jgi:carboxyl-terminal processing protease
MRSEDHGLAYRLTGLRTTLLLGTAFLAGAAIGPTARLISHLGIGFAAFAAQDSDRANTYQLLALFGDVFERVRAEYVDPVSDRDLIENAINGMLAGLDPHSSYLNADEYREVQVETKGKFGDLGIEITQDNGLIKVTDTMDERQRPRAGSRQATSSLF